MPRVVPAPNGEGKTAWALQDNSLKGPWGFRTKEKVQCLCEGGRSCTRENPASQKGGNAIPGLHCNWVGEQQLILAAARPWQENITRMGLVDVLIKQGIGMILNLEEVGEHDSCGPGNLRSSGFSYDPETFMAARIGFYNFSWRDMGVPDLDRMMDIVQVMDYVTGTEGRKILVHCHAGLGRTGLAIACFFLFTQQYSARRAIEAVRRDRPGALQTRQQELFTFIFEQYLAHLRCVFSGAELAEAEKRAASPTKARPGTATGTGAPGHNGKSLSGSVPNQSISDVGTPTDVKESGGTRTEVYASGLTIVKPLQAPTAGVGNSSLAAITEEDVGLDHSLPWNATFHIQPGQYSKSWLPNAPRTYTEALKRQQRVLHGPERRTYLHLHRFLKEAVFALIASAQQHDPATNTAPSPAPAAPAPPIPAPTAPYTPSYASSQPSAAVARPLDRGAPPVPAPAPAGPSNAGTRGGAVLQPAAPPIPASALTANPQAPGLPTQGTSAAVPLVSVAGPGPVAESSTGAGVLAAQPRPAGPGTAASTGVGGQASTSGRPALATGGKGVQKQGPELPTSFAHAFALCISHHSVTSVDQETLDAMGRLQAYRKFVGSDGSWPALHDYLLRLQHAANYADHAPLGAAPLIVILMALEHMFRQFEDGHPALSTATLQHAADVYDSLPYDVQPGPEPVQFQAALKLLEPIPAADQELLLLFVSLLRHTAIASGPGCEEHVVSIARWVLGLLLGRQLAAHPAGMEVMLSLLWYFLRNDIGYASLILAKLRRIDRRSHVGMSTPMSSPNLQEMEELARQQERTGGGAGASALAAALPFMPPRASRTALLSLTQEDSAGIAPDMYARGVQLPSAPITGGADGGTPQSYYRDQMPVLPGIPPGMVPAEQLAGMKLGMNGVQQPGAVGEARPVSRGMTPPLLAALPPMLKASGRLPPVGAPAGLPAALTGGDSLSRGVVAVVSLGPDGRPDPRLYGGAAPAAESVNMPSLKEQLAGIPGTYVPPTVPGAEEVVVHDVWI